VNTFVKTFFVCLIACVSFLAYKYFCNESYNKNLQISQTNPIFSVQNEKIQKKENVENFIPKKTEINKNYEHYCYFYGANGKLTKIKRELKTQPTIETVVAILLKGLTIQESKNGLYSEIPPNVDLINVTKKSNSVIVNLSSNFGNGGGSQSVKNRVYQLAKTVKLIEPNKPIYLHINGKEVEYLGGDGVYIEQPLK